MPKCGDGVIKPDLMSRLASSRPRQKLGSLNQDQGQDSLSRWKIRPRRCLDITKSAGILYDTVAATFVDVLEKHICLTIKLAAIQTILPFADSAVK